MNLQFLEQCKVPQLYLSSPDSLSSDKSAPAQTIYPWTIMLQFLIELKRDKTFATSLLLLLWSITQEMSTISHRAQPAKKARRLLPKSGLPPLPQSQFCCLLSLTPQPVPAVQPVHDQALLSFVCTLGTTRSINTFFHKSPILIIDLQFSVFKRKMANKQRKI